MPASNNFSQLQVSCNAPLLTYSDVDQFKMVIFGYLPFWLIIPLFSLLSILLYPFYNLVFNKNRESEHDTPIYPILQHFHKIVKYVFLWTSFIVIWMVSAPFLIVFHSDKWSWLLLITSFFYFHTITFFTPIFNSLLIALAVQRFILYFKPEFGGLVTFKPSTWTHILNFFYFLSAVFRVGYYIHAEQSLAVGKDGYWNIVRNQMILEPLVMVSTLFYIPIFYSIRKLRHLQSVQSAQPERYVRYQAVLLFFLKVPIVYLFLTAVLDGINGCPEFGLDDESFFIPVLIQAVSFSLLPVTIEVTYLWCNKRNVKELIKIVTLKYVIDYLLCRRKATATVDPLNLSTRI